MKESEGQRGREDQAGSAAAWAVCAVIGVALLVRAVVALETREVPTMRHLIGDAAGYYRWAQDIAGGAWVGTEAFYQAPLYPYVLAGCFRVFGDEVWKVRLVQAAWGAAGCGLVWMGTCRLFGRRAGVVAGMMLALYGPAIFYDGLVQKASLTGLLVCGLFAATTWCGASASRSEAVQQGDTGRRLPSVQRGKGLKGVNGDGDEKTARRLRSGFGSDAVSALVIGAAAGLLAITRENAMVWLPVVGAWIWSKRRMSNVEWGMGKETSKSQNVKKANGAIRRRGWAAVGAYVFGVSMVLVPVGVRNAVVSGEWSVSTFQAGPNFYIGNHRGADGRYQPLVRGHETPEFERDDATSLAQRAVGRALGAKEVSQYWTARTIEDIRADPGGWLGLLGRKMAMVWNRYEVSDAESPYIYRESSAVLGVLSRTWHFGALCPLAVVGIMATWSERGRLWVYYALMASMAAAVAAFYVLGRYRYPLALLLIPFAAAGCVDVWRRVRGGDVRRLMSRSVVAAVVAGAVNVSVHDERRLNAMARMNVGVALAEAGEPVAAEECFRRALDDHPQSAEGHNNLAQALALRGDFAGAVEHYQEALAAGPGLIGVDFNLGVALERVGRIEEALKAYERAAARDPSDAEARAAVVRLRGG